MPSEAIPGTSITDTSKLPHMTISQFFDELKRLNTRWRFGGLHKLSVRTDIDPYTTCCPITAVANAKLNTSFYSLTNWQMAANELGLRPEFAAEVMKAADADGQYNKNWRKRLLAACKLN
jgi:hypothetical protein